MNDPKKIDKISKDIDDIKSRYKTPEEQEKDYQEQEKTDWSGYVLGLNLLVSVLVCAAIGFLLDKFFPSGGFWIVGFVVLGFCAGIWQIWKKLNENE